MKKLTIGLGLSLSIVLLGGCSQSGITLDVRFDSFRIELGNPILKSAEYYIDKDGITDNDLKNLYKQAKVDFESNDSDLIHNKYEKTGTYHMNLTYKDQVKDFDIIVKDTRAPQIKGDNILYVKTNSHIDYKSLYKINDYNEVEDLIIDDSHVNVDKIGEYNLNLSVKDKAGNIGEKQVKVIVQDIIKKETKNKVVMDIPYYNQLDVDAPNGCEATSIYMALKYKDKIDIALTKFIDEQPKADNPNDGFAGDPFGVGKKKDDYYTIFPTPLANYASQYSKCKDISGSSLEDIKKELASNRPVAVYVTGGLVPAKQRTLYFGNVISNLHIVLLSGYDENARTFSLLDPIDENITSISYERFSKAYDLTKFAINVE